MSKYYFASQKLEHRNLQRLWPRVKDSLSQALERTTGPETTKDLAALAESLTEAIRRTVDKHREEVARRRHLNELTRHMEQNMRDVGAEPTI